MKKILIAAFSAVLLLSSCSKEDNENSQNVDALKVENVLNFKTKSGSDPDAERTAFNLLNSSEKATYWQTKLGDFIIDDTTLSYDEILLIEEVKAQITSDIYEETDNDKKEYFKNIFVPDFLDRVDDVMPTSKIEHIFYGYTQFTPGVKKKKCDCNRGSMFGCAASDHCDEKKCEKESNGCGFLWAWECNGICFYTDF